MTFITNVWNSIKGTSVFASLEDGDKLFANNPFYEQVKDDIELLQEAGNDFSKEAILAGELTPVFFGSALTNFGYRLSWKPSSSLLQNHTATRRQMENLSILMTRISQALSLKSSQYGPSSPRPDRLCADRIWRIWAWDERQPASYW